MRRRERKGGVKSVTVLRSGQESCGVNFYILNFKHLFSNGRIMTIILSILIDFLFLDRILYVLKNCILSDQYNY